MNLTNWKLLKVIISNRDRHFLSDLWTKLLVRFDVKLLYSTTYYFKIDEPFERINQIFEIALKFHIQMFKNSRNWSTIISPMQKTFNNCIISIEKSFNEICYEFTSLRNTNLILQKTKNKTFFFKQIIENHIAHLQMFFKQLYNEKHKSIQLQSND